jgi:hypothetical protein
MDPWNTLGTAASFFSSKDVTYSQVLAAKKALEILAANKDTVTPIVQLCLACSNNDVYTIKDLLTENRTILNTLDSKGLTPLIYAICFHNNECVDLLLTFNVDCNEPDNFVGWTPVMWATYLDYEDILERLISYNADPKKKVGKSMKNALDLIKPGSKSEEYFKIHGYLREESQVSELADGFYSNNSSNVHLATNNMNNLSLNSHHETNFVDNEDVIFDSNFDTTIFNFNYLQSKQYIKFNDDSIRSIMDYVFKLQTTHHTKPLYPSSIIFQCLRYAEHKMKSSGMVQNLIDLYLTRIRNVTGTKSGVVQFYGEKERKEREKKKKKERDTNPDPPPVDIVTISYWISALNHLYYFLIRDTASNFFSKYPQLLQEIILCLQSLVFKLAFTLDAKLEPLLEPCILEYNSVPDVDVIYKNDWRIFKNKSKTNKKTSYEEIIDMLYPPSYSDQMKPSPLKVIQTLGALLYVLELFYISDIIKQQCLSAVLYFIGCNLFNKVISTKKYCSRVKAMETRLNLSYIQDWLRANNLQPFIEEDGNFDTVLSWKGDGFPDNLIDKPIGYLNNVCRFNGDERDPTDATYYLNPLFKIGQYSLQPVIELAEWLQVLTGIQTVEELEDIVEKFGVISSSTMVQCIRNYHYEIDEKKFSKSLKKWLKEHPYNENDNLEEKGMFYKDASKLVLNQGQAFPISLPRTVQLLHQYGADFKHVDEKRLMAYQPHIPLDIRDDIETIVDENNEPGQNTGLSKRFTDEEDEGDEDEDYSNDYQSKQSGVENDSENAWGHQNQNEEGIEYRNITKEHENVHNGEKPSELFTELSVPTTAAHKTWQDDSNPWA